MIIFPYICFLLVPLKWLICDPMIEKLHSYWVVALLSLLTLVPFLGLTDYHTKGEPRESIVAYTMLETGNWVLPENIGGDIAYKPPLFHWMVAAASLPAGEVTEFSSRLPSALALVAIILAGYRFFARRRGAELAFLMAIITLTNFEVHRAAFACRVDMVLTAFIVLALYALYRWWEGGLRGLPWWAILCMGCGTLTKGPVGFLLPCATMGVLLWMRGGGFWFAVRKLIPVGLLACILPAVWYVAAYRQGGDQFLDLVIEENFSRFVGKMSYASHENPVWYNFMTVITGYVPYTLLALFVLPLLKWRGARRTIAERWTAVKRYFREMDETRLFALLSIVVIFVFYCIPKSKRSVYLLPIYPFIAYFLAELFVWLYRNRKGALRWFAALISGLCGLLSLLFVAIRTGLVPASVFGDGKHAAENIAFLNALGDDPISLLGWVCLLLPAAASVWYFVRVHRSDNYRTIGYAALGAVLALFVALDGYYQPTVLNTKSDKRMAAEIAAIVPDGPIYSYVKQLMLRFYVVNFYTDNRVVLFEKEQPTEGYLLIGRKDAARFLPTYTDRYRFEQVYESTKRGCDVRDIIQLYRFGRTAETEQQQEP